MTRLLQQLRCASAHSLLAMLRRRKTSAIDFWRDRAVHIGAQGLLLLLLGMWGNWPGPATAAQSVTAFNTYMSGPYRVDGQHGLAQSLIDRLNHKIGPGYRLSLFHIPRIRLDATELNRGAQFDGMVLFVNPIFVGDAAKTRFLWSKPLFIDCNLVISRATAPLEYLGRVSFEGRRFGGVRGYRYTLIDELVQTGKLLREDSQDELSSLRKVALARVDVTVVPYSIYSFVGADAALSRQLHVAAKPYQCFARHILVGKSNPALLGAINKAIDSLTGDREWLNALTYFHLDINVLSAWGAEQAPASE